MGLFLTRSSFFPCVLSKGSLLDLASNLREEYQGITGATLSCAASNAQSGRCQEPVLPLVPVLDRGMVEFLPFKSGVKGIRSLVILDLKE